MDFTLLFQDDPSYKLEQDLKKLRKERFGESNVLIVAIKSVLRSRQKKNENSSLGAKTKSTNA